MAPAVPAEPGTLAHRLHQWAVDQADTLALSYLEQGDFWSSLTYAQLHRRAAALAQLLRDADPSNGQRFVLIALPPGVDYVVAFYASLYAGTAAVTFYPPTLATSRATEDYRMRLRQIIEDCRPAVIVAQRDLHGRITAELSAGDAVRLLVDPAELPVPAAAATVEPAGSPGDLALLQYTSGSTSRPKGVMVSNANLVHNVRGLTAALSSAPGESATGWLPLFHDMGLIGMICHPLWAGMSVHMLTPSAFLRRPLLWPETMSRTRSVLTIAPNFGYDSVARRVTPDQAAALDLSCVRHALNGAEPVRRLTIDRFSATLAPAGFRSQALMPVYGMAEATLCVSAFHRAGDQVLVEVSGRRLSTERRAVPPAAGERTATIVGCGRAFTGDTTVAIADPEHCVPCPDGSVGEIWVSGPSVAQGYWQRPDATAETFGAQLPGDDRRYLRTGDLGLVLDGVVFVVGRMKDVIIRHGVNHAPQDLEATAEQSHSALRAGGGVAVTVPSTEDDLGREQVVLIHELDRHGPDVDHSEIISAVRRAVAEVHGLQPDAVALVRGGKVPKTTSGKVRRKASVERWLAGDFRPVAVWSRQPALGSPS